MADLKHYCTVDDVSALCPQVPFTAQSKPSDQQVATFIEDIALRMDATLGYSGYIVPVVDGPQALAILRRLCSWGALGLAQQVRETGVSTAISDRGVPMRNVWTKMFEDEFAQLIDAKNPYRLPDCQTTDSLKERPEDVLVSAGGDDPDQLIDNPVVTRYQTL